MIKEKLSRNFYQPVKQKIKLIIHTKGYYQNERSVKATEINDKHFCVFLRDETRLPAPSIQNLKKMTNSIKENIKINNIPHGSWLNYFQNPWSQVDESCNMQPPSYQNSEATTLHFLQRCKIIKFQQRIQYRGVKNS
jgi:hypothetical protein